MHYHSQQEEREFKVGKIVILVTFFLSLSILAQDGGAEGGGGPSITLRETNPELYYQQLEDYLRELAGEGSRGGRYNFENLPERILDWEEVKNEGDWRDLVKAELEGHTKKRVRFKKPVDLEVSGLGVVDVQTFKDAFPSSLWHEEEDDLYIDALVPIKNWQDDFGEIKRFE